MSYNQYKSLNTTFMCFKEDREVFKPRGDRHDQQQVEQGIERKIVQDFADAKGIQQFNILKQPIYAKFIFLNLLGRYYAGDFIPETTDKKFLVEINKVWIDLVTKGFFGDIGIAYGDSYLEIEKAGVIKNGANGFDPSNRPFSKLRIYVMENPQTTQLEPFPRFRSVGTNVGGLKFDPNKLVNTTCNGFNNFIYCWNVLDDYLGTMEVYINYFYASVKSIVVDVQNPTKFEKEMTELQSSKNIAMILDNASKGSGEGDNEWEEFPAPDVSSCGIVLGNILSYVDERLRGLGCYGKVMNQTKEHTGVGEAGIDHKGVNNVRETFRISLEALIEELKIKNPELPEDLKLKPTTQEPHMDERFKEQGNGKGGNVSEGDHYNSIKGLKKDKPA